MNRSALPVTILLALLAAACGDNGGKDLFETAQFEEKQNNVLHAKELYQDILAKYPQSEYARKAEARLQRLNEAK
jgi:outer membrane protein assembly factor BamD (BamD/ComL family)